ncbi:hypothetical protein PSY31_22825, partial [Shigella flexneri]|nr:hypothetical protein [Shigella flexneri]
MVATTTQSEIELKSSKEFERKEIEKESQKNREKNFKSALATQKPMMLILHKEAYLSATNLDNSLPHTVYLLLQEF